MQTVERSPWARCASISMHGVCTLMGGGCCVAPTVNGCLVGDGTCLKEVDTALDYSYLITTPMFTEI
jgi:hypothetical protein